MAELARYLARIDHSDRPLPDLATLRALHRRHVEAIPFEALDVLWSDPESDALWLQTASGLAQIAAP